VYCAGKTESIDGFDAKVETLAGMLERATAARPVLTLDAEF
jgi:hypothetical protein